MGACCSVKTHKVNTMKRNHSSADIIKGKIEMANKIKQLNLNELEIKVINARFIVERLQLLNA